MVLFLKKALILFHLSYMAEAARDTAASHGAPVGLIPSGSVGVCLATPAV